MGIIDYSEAPELKPEGVPSLIESPEAKSILIDTEYIPRRNILTQISGAPWRVNLYTQVLGKDSALYGLSPGKDRLNQAFIKTNNYIIRVTSALTTSQDTTTNTMNVNGSANIVPGVKVNNGDVFTASIGDGRLGIFRIIAVEEKSYFKDSSAAIDYILVAWADSGQGKKYYDDLESKVIKIVNYVNEFLDYNQNPYLTDEDYETYQYIKNTVGEMLNYHLRVFISKEFKALKVPCQPGVNYHDHFLTKFLHRSFDINDSRLMINFKQFNFGDDPWMESLTIWDALSERDASMVSLGTKTFALVPYFSFENEGLLEGFYYSGFDGVLYPKDAAPTADLTEGTRRLKNVFREPLSASHDLSSIGTYNDTPLIHQACKDGFYALSEHFYKRDKQMSLLEAQVWQYLENEPCNQNIVTALAKDYKNWGSLEKFYYLPMLILLMNSVIRGM